MKKLIYFFSLTLLCFQTGAQTDTSKRFLGVHDVGEGDLVPDIERADIIPVVVPDSIGTFISVEEMPEFIGGEDSLWRFIQNNLVYPQAAKANVIEGKIKIKFVVTATGEIINPIVVSREKLGYGCEEAAIAVISKMPRWKPGKQNNKLVPVHFILPIMFKIH